MGDRLVLELAALRLADAKPGQAEVAVDRHRAGLVDVPRLDQLVHPLRRPLAHQKVHDRPLALEQPGDKALADETGRAGDEVVHGGPPSSGVLLAPRAAAAAPRWADDYMPAYRPASTGAFFSVRPLDARPRLRTAWAYPRIRR